MLLQISPGQNSKNLACKLAKKVAVKFLFFFFIDHKDKEKSPFRDMSLKSI